VIASHRLSFSRHSLSAPRCSFKFQPGYGCECVRSRVVHRYTVLATKSPDTAAHLVIFMVEQMTVPHVVALRRVEVIEILARPGMVANAGNIRRCQPHQDANDLARAQIRGVLPALFGRQRQRSIRPNSKAKGLALPVCASVVPDGGSSRKRFATLCSDSSSWSLSGSLGLIAAISLSRIAWTASDCLQSWSRS
jgi:hypothetical protein